MNGRIYSFTEQLRIGKLHERQLDRYFERWFHIVEAGMNEQRRGIDRTFTGRRDGRRLKVEYKADRRAAETGNAFIETRSGSKPGWALTCEADRLVYFIPQTGEVIVVKPKAIKAKVNEWRQRFGVKTVPNKGWTMDGIPVPLAELRDVSDTVRTIKGCGKRAAA